MDSGLIRQVIFGRNSYIRENRFFIEFFRERFQSIFQF